MQAFYASVDALPDSILIVIICIAAFFIGGLMDERDRSRRARWIPPAAKPQPKPEERKEAA